MIGPFEGKYRWLSNFEWCLIVYEGAVYPTVEHAYQAAKTINLLERLDIEHAASPAEAKRLGKKVTVRADWNKVKLSIMETLLRQKFSQPEFHNRLIETGTEELVEVNYWKDTFWGQYNGVGSNHLGRLIMRIRGDLQ